MKTEYQVSKYTRINYFFTFYWYLLVFMGLIKKISKTSIYEGFQKSSKKPVDWIFIPRNSVTYETFSECEFSNLVENDDRKLVMLFESVC